MNARASKKQQELLQFIDDFIKEHGYGPSYREIMRGLGYKSVSTVAVHVDGLLIKGYIRKKDHSARSIEIASTHLPVSPENPDLVRLLEEVITKKIRDGGPESELAVLIEAAQILGSSKAETLKDMLEKIEK